VAVSSVERVVAVPGMSPGAFTVFSEVLSAGAPAQALHEAVRAGNVCASDLPEMIANVWTRDDSPTTGLSEGAWVEIFRAAAFFSYPPCRPAAGREPGSPHNVQAGDLFSQGCTAARQGGNHHQLPATMPMSVAP
jgi:hypothetical protein